jgi:ubiquitin C-terminal hydrolase
MFKDALGNYQKMFLGDTTEFFNYLLDGFHEDSNKVQNKPIIKSNDDTNVSNATLSHNSWINFLRRNQSILVEIFYDQFNQQLNILIHHVIM